MKQYTHTTDKIQSDIDMSTRAIKSGPGYEILRKMGWEDTSGLGKRGGGMKEPVEVKPCNIRMGKDTRGLGFGVKEDIVRPVPGEMTVAVVKISSSGENYGVGSSFFGKVYIPGGIIRHLQNRTQVSSYNLIGKTVRVAIVASDESSRHPWRAVRCI